MLFQLLEMTLCSQADECQKALGQKNLKVLVLCELSGEQTLETCLILGVPSSRAAGGMSQGVLLCSDFLHIQPSVNQSEREFNAVSNKCCSIL